MPYTISPLLILQGYYPSTSSAYFMLSDHSRQPLSISNEKVESAVRMANGLTRKYIVSNKNTFSLNWDNLPSSAYATVDNGAGAANLELFYDLNYNSTVTVYLFRDSPSLGGGSPLSSGLSILNTAGGKITTMPTASATAEILTMYIDSYSAAINKRYYGGGTLAKGYYDLWNVSMTLKEA